MDAQSRETVIQHAVSLPLVGKHEEDERILDGYEAISLWRELREHESVMPEHVKIQVDFVLDEVLRETNATPDGKRLIMTKEELRGALVRMAIRGTAQGLYDVGGVLQETSLLDRLQFEPADEPEAPSAQN